MHIQPYRLPPLPKNHSRMIILSQKIPIRPKRKSNEALTPSRNSHCNIQSMKDLSNKHISRPLSTKSSERGSRQNSIESENASRKQITAFDSFPEISAKSWALYEMKQRKCLASKRGFKKREIASLTKMMNLMACIQMTEKMRIDPKQLKIIVSSEASTITGTTAELKQFLQISLYDLYFGMMLPSGNDAAWQIAQCMGSLSILQRTGKMEDELIYNPQLLSAFCSRVSNSSVKVYLNAMNALSRQLGMHFTNFANPHGLSNTSNFSTAEDVAKLCMYSMSNPTFRQVVNTRSHQWHGILNGESINGKWDNTNRMLGQGWSGIKTGVTPNAGPCLAASVKKVIDGRQVQFLIILLSSDTMQARWCEVRNLVDWAIRGKHHM